MTRARTVLRDRNVALLWASSVVSATGTGAMFVALPLHTYVATGSVIATALVTMAEFAPTVGIAQLAGVVVDRRDPRRVLIISNLVLSMCTLGYLAPEGWWWLAVVSFVRSSVAQLLSPATHTLQPAVTPPGRLVEVNALNAIGGNAARLAGPALGGVLVGLGGLSLVAVLDAASFVAASILTLAIRTTRPTDRPGSASGPVAFWLQGLSMAIKHPTLGPLVMIMALIGFGEGFVSALLAPWMTDIAGGGGTDLGLMLSLQATGGILGGILVLRWAERWPSLALLGAGGVASATFLVVIINYPLIAPVGPWPAIILNAFAGLPFAVVGTAQSITVQTDSVDGYRGRIVSVTYGAQGLAQLLGIGLAGPAAALLGPLAINTDALAYLVAGVAALVIIWRRRHHT